MWLAFPLLFACSSTPEAPPQQQQTQTEQVTEPSKSAKRRKPSKQDVISERDALEALGYVAGEELATDDGGVSIHDADNALNGTNLITSAHGLEVVLTDMAAEVLHTWSLDPEEHGVDARRAFFRRAWLLEDGAILAIIEYDSLWKIAPDGTVVWHVRDRNHHDVWLADDGSFYSLVRRSVKGATWWGDQDPLLEDAIAHYSPDGERLEVVSVHHALQRSTFTELFAFAAEQSGDALHLNSVQLLDGSAADKHPAFAAGNFLVSSRKMGHLMVVDPKKKAVVWIHSGPYSRQHEATVQPDGGVLLFDNHGLGQPAGALELQLPDMKRSWAFYGKGERAFRSHCCGTAQRLDNGNTLVVATTDGLAVEVTAKNKRVWEFKTPYRTAEDDSIRANLFDVVRYAPADQLPWLKGAPE